MSAHALLNLLNKLGKKIRMLGLVGEKDVRPCRASYWFSPTS